MPVLPLVGSISRTPGLQLAARFGAQDHRARRAIFHAACWVVAFELAEQADLSARKTGGDLHQRCLANRVDDLHDVFSLSARPRDVPPPLCDIACAGRSGTYLRAKLGHTRDIIKWKKANSVSNTCSMVSALRKPWASPAYA